MAAQSQLEVRPLPEFKTEMVQSKDVHGYPSRNDFMNNDSFNGLYQDDLPKVYPGNTESGEVVDEDIDGKLDLTSFMVQGMTCTNCGKFFKSKNGLSLHMNYCGKANHEIVKFKCYFCHFETKWKKSLKGHIEQKHPIGGIYYLVCPVCQKYFKGKRTLKVHMKYCGKTNVEMKKFKCFLCQFKTKYKLSLKEHIMQKHPIDTIDYVLCPLCQKNLKGEKRLKIHLRSCGKPNLDRFKCLLCSYKSKYKKCLNRHLSAKHFTQQIVRHYCTGCGKSYVDKYSLSTHMKYHCKKTSVQILEFKCFLCAFVTKYKRSLERHILQKHPIDAIDYLACPVCKNSFKGNINLKKHMKYCGKPSAVKFICYYCRYEARWKGNLIGHIKRKHPSQERETKSQICPGCNKSYNYKGCLKKHLKYCGKTRDEMDKFRCPMCPFKTKWKKSLERHSTAHITAAIELPGTLSEVCNRQPIDFSSVTKKTGADDGVAIDYSSTTKKTEAVDRVAIDCLNVITKTGADDGVAIDFSNAAKKTGAGDEAAIDYSSDKNKTGADDGVAIDYSSATKKTGADDID